MGAEQRVEYEMQQQKKQIGQFVFDPIELLRAIHGKKACKPILATETAFSGESSDSDMDIKPKGP